MRASSVEIDAGKHQVRLVNPPAGYGVSELDVGGLVKLAIEVVELVAGKIFGSANLGQTCVTTVTTTTHPDGTSSTVVTTNCTAG